MMLGKNFKRGRNIATFALSSLAFAAACSSGTLELTGSSQEALTCTEYPETGFDTAPSYIGRHVFALTYDDGPDEAGETTRLLDMLKSQYPAVKVSFYLNTVNKGTVDTNPTLQNVIRRMRQDGHEISNHTKGHKHLPLETTSVIESEITGVQTTINNIFGASAPRLSRVRAPFGEPYVWPRNPDEIAKVAPIVAANGVHVGWNIDSNDWRCASGNVAQDASCVCNNVKSAIDGGAYGIILMHSIHAKSVNATSCIIDYLRSKTWGGQAAQFWTSEQVVEAKFGKSSAAVVDGRCGGSGTGGSTGSGGSAGSSGTAGSGGSSASGGTGGSTGSCSKPAWNPNATYLKDDEASYNAKEYRAKWWTRGDVPENNTGAGLPWEVVRSCTGSCTPNCAGKTCGDDGCNGSCGTCSSGQTCNGSGQCQSTCVPNCSGKTCGDNGCNGSCGTCSSGQTCGSSGQCQSTCVPNCSGKTCGDNGCNGSCGTCSSGQTCNSSGQCQASTGCSPTISSYTAGKCNATVVYEGKLYKCISQAAGVNGEAAGCGTPGVYCSTITPTNAAWGSTAWQLIQSCP